MEVITAPDKWNPPVRLTNVFLAGGITNCPDWQSEVLKIMHEKYDHQYLPLRVFNPRRPNFDIREKGIEEEQIQWEHMYLEICEVISFWFPADTLCPITLFELGKHLKSDKKLIIGCDPEYKRISDVRIQTRLERPGLKISDNLESHASAIAMCS